MNVAKRPIAHHPAKRASPGRPEMVERFQIRMTAAQKDKVMRRGGAGWIRKLIDKEL